MWTQISLSPHRQLNPTSTLFIIQLITLATTWGGPKRQPLSHYLTKDFKTEKGKKADSELITNIKYRPVLIFVFPFRYFLLQL